MKTFIVACAQFGITPNDVTANVEKAVAWIERAVKENEAELVVLPETITTGASSSRFRAVGSAPSVMWSGSPSRTAAPSTSTWSGCPTSLFSDVASPSTPPRLRIWIRSPTFSSVPTRISGLPFIETKPFRSSIITPWPFVSVTQNDRLNASISFNCLLNNTLE